MTNNTPSGAKKHHKSTEPEDEWYVVIKDYKFTILEIFENYHILRVHAIPYIWV